MGEKFPLNNIIWEALGDLKQNYCESFSNTRLVY